MFHKIKRAAEAITFRAEAEKIRTQITNASLSDSQKRELNRILDEKLARCTR